MASAAPFDPFEALGLPRDASAATIKARYRELARRYHPNRHQCTGDSKAALDEQFHTVHQAYRYLKEPETRRRYLELLRLVEEQDALLGRMSDLLITTKQSEKQVNESGQKQEGYVSSDVDEDLPHVGPVRRKTFERAMAGTRHLGDAPQLSPPSRHGSSRKRPTITQPLAVSTTHTGLGEGDYFSKRRKMLEKLRRKELAAFDQYKSAMVAKFEAELEVERQRDLYERAVWKREYFERAPKETSERFRSFQHFMSAYRAFGSASQPRRSRNRSSLSEGHQILSTDGFIDGDQYLNAENAASPTRSRAMHRRGWSSDITGDQTSSDGEDNASPGRGSARRGVSPRAWDRRHKRNTSLDAFQLSSAFRTNGTPTPTTPDHAPFKMIVKRPTGLSGLIEGQDTSPESATTSRSPSPRTPDHCGTQFTLVQSRHMLELFPSGTPHDSVISDTETSTGHGNSSSVHGDVGLTGTLKSFVVKTVGRTQFKSVSFQNVQELSFAEKSWMLNAQGESESEHAALLQRLARLDPNVADKFMIKMNIIESFRFRLIYGHHDRFPAKDKSSFIALSYRRKLHVEKKDSHFTLPLDQEMFQAIWDERQSEDEGVWIDQICIDQESRSETTISMSAMDMVYRSARLVIVALDDIGFDAHERDVFEHHMEDYEAMRNVVATKRFRGRQPPYLETHEELYNVLRKLLRSSWFKRAWCRHEMRLARDHIFLVPCRSPGTWTGKNVVRFTGECLTHLLALAIEVPFEPDVELVKPPLHAFFRDRSKLAPHEKHLHSHHGNFTTVIAEVFGMEAGGDPKIPPRQRAADALKDKIAIILNTIETGLALTPAMRDPNMPLTKAEGHYMLLLLALAAQDPGALCSVGPPMRLVQAETDSPLSPTASSTWLFEPTNVDSGLNNYRTLNRLPSSSLVTTGLQGGEHFVKLDLKFVRPDNVQYGEDQQNLELALHFFDVVCEDRKLGRNRKRYLVSDAAANRHFGSMKDVYVKTLACVFDLGPDWVEDICHRYGVSRWKQDGESAINLLIALKSTDGRWPEHAWTNQQAGFIMDFVNFLIIRGMPQRQIIHHEEWRPLWVRTPNGGKVLTFIPPGNVHTAVPTALLDPDYVHLARLWVLEPRTWADDFQPHDDSLETQWTLLGKSVLFTDDLALEQLPDRGGTCRDQQQVFGRQDPTIEKLLRERSLLF